MTVPAGAPAVVQDPHQLRGDDRRGAGGLDDDGVAGDERRARHPREDRQGEVPGRDDEGDAERPEGVLAVLERPHARAGPRPRGAGSRGRSTRGSRSASPTSASASRQRLAGLEDLERGELEELGAHELRGAEEDRSALGRRRGAPAVEGRARGGQRLLRLRLTGVGGRADDLLRPCRVDRGERLGSSRRSRRRSTAASACRGRLRPRPSARARAPPRTPPRFSGREKSACGWFTNGPGKATSVGPPAGRRCGDAVDVW